MIFFSTNMFTLYLEHINGISIHFNGERIFDGTMNRQCKSVTYTGDSL